MGHGCNYQKNQCDIIPPFPTTIDFASRHKWRDDIDITWIINSIIITLINGNYQSIE